MDGRAPRSASPASLLFDGGPAIHSDDVALARGAVESVTCLHPRRDWAARRARQGARPAPPAEHHAAVEGDWPSRGFSCGLWVDSPGQVWEDYHSVRNVGGTTARWLYGYKGN